MGSNHLFPRCGRLVEEGLEFAAASLADSTVWRIVRRAAERAGIEGKVSPHWLRHCNASHALARGCSIAVVRQTLGHASLASTSEYVHAKPEDSSGLYLRV